MGERDRNRQKETMEPFARICFIPAFNPFGTFDD